MKAHRVYTALRRGFPVQLARGHLVEVQRLVESLLFVGFDPVVFLSRGEEWNWRDLGAELVRAL